MSFNLPRSPWVFATVNHENPEDLSGLNIIFYIYHIVGKLELPTPKKHSMHFL